MYEECRFWFYVVFDAPIKSETPTQPKRKKIIIIIIKIKFAHDEMTLTFKMGWVASIKQEKACTGGRGCTGGRHGGPPPAAHRGARRRRAGGGDPRRKCITPSDRKGGIIFCKYFMFGNEQFLKVKQTNKEIVILFFGVCFSVLQYSCREILEKDLLKLVA